MNHKLRTLALVCAVVFTLLLCALPSFAQTSTNPSQNWPAPTEGDYVVHDFHFQSGETLPEIRLHYYTLGTPVKDATGRTTNAVLILHGTGGSGNNFLHSIFAGELFGPGQLLDANKYFLVLPDNIGRGKSSKPSDGLHAHFPRYEYVDMVTLQHELVEKGLGVNHLRLIMGTSMGCAHSWMWGESLCGFHGRPHAAGLLTRADRRTQSHLAQDGD